MVIADIYNGVPDLCRYQSDREFTPKLIGAYLTAVEIAYASADILPLTSKPQRQWENPMLHEDNRDAFALTLIKQEDGLSFARFWSRSGTSVATVEGGLASHGEDLVHRQARLRNDQGRNRPLALTPEAIEHVTEFIMERAGDGGFKAGRSPRMQIKLPKDL